MKVYVDFDHTLYNTKQLISKMINCIADYIYDNGDFEKYSENFKKAFPNIEEIPIPKDKNKIKEVLRANFKRPDETTLNIKYNVFELAKKFAELFSCNYEKIEEKIDATLDNGKDNLYNDSEKFLKDLKADGNEVYILSHEGNDLSFQDKKIKGAGVFNEKLLNGVIITKISKAELNEENYNDSENTLVNMTSPKYARPAEVDYEHGVFIDDRPKDLENLYKSAYKGYQPPFKIRIYRMARDNGTYSSKELDNRCKNGVVKFKNFEEIFKALDSQTNSSKGSER